MDSVEFLQETARQTDGRGIDFVYLDSFDIDFEKPMPAAEHCLKEFEAIYPVLTSGAVLLIDDSPSDPRLIPNAFSRVELSGFGSECPPPGKGMLVETLLASQGIRRLVPGYQALYVIDG